MSNPDKTDSHASEDAPFNLQLALRDSVRDGASLAAHLQEIERDIDIDGTKAKLHCYSVQRDAHGRVRIDALVDHLKHRIVDYAIPRTTIEEAVAQASIGGATGAITKLYEKARSLFTDLANTGEGGELLVFAIAESIFGLPQILCKMSLKTNTRMHYHGADGVYAEVRDDGGFNLYWGESKVFGDPTEAIRDCLKSLSPFLLEPDSSNADREQDIWLINEFAKFSDPKIVQALKDFLNRDHPASLKTKQCGFALVAFDCTAYGDNGPDVIADEVMKALKAEISGWQASTKRRLTAETLEQFDIHVICVPLPSAEAFRSAFLKAMGISPQVKEKKDRSKGKPDAA